MYFLIAQFDTGTWQFCFSYLYFYNWFRLSVVLTGTRFVEENQKLFIKTTDYLLLFLHLFR